MRKWVSIFLALAIMAVFAVGCGVSKEAKIKCPKCENNLAIWWLRQLRAADESEVRFFRCTECGHTWRQYD